MDEKLRRAIRQSFERAAGSYDHAAFLQREIARRLDDHLEGVKIAPGLILDAGCGTGFGVPLLKARYPEARFIALDIAHAMLKETMRQQGRAGGWRGLRSYCGNILRTIWSAPSSRLAPVCADLERLPLARASVDMVWSSLALQWVDLPRAFAEVNRVLKPDGLFLFASFGPDTLKELRAAFDGLDGHGHVNRFTDMHDVGDALVHAGFSNPVMEMETLTLTYADLKGLLADLKAIGAHTVLEGRRTGLMGRAKLLKLMENYERFRADGRLPATYEVVYGHAWAGRKDRLPDGRRIVEFQRRAAP